MALALVVVAALCGGAASAAERDDAPAVDDLAPAVPSPATPVLSARRVPTVIAAPVADRRLVAAVDAVMAGQDGSACLTVSVGGRVVYGRAPDAPMTPASLQKLVTAVAALDVLGPDFRYRTRVVAAAPPVDGVVAGDVWLVGSGDPLLATAEYVARFRNQPQPVTPVESLADALVAAGVRRVEGRLLGDESRYDADRYPDPWPSRFIDQDQSGPLSALSVNDAWVAFPPHHETSVPDETPAPDPAAHGAGVLALLLAERGVAVGATGSGPAPAGAVELAAVDSVPLVEVVGQLLRESDNQTGELLLKEIAVASGRPGTTPDGAAVAAEVVAGLGLPVPDPLVVDGSGLAGENRLSCLLVQAILDREGPGSAIADGLAVAGSTGTLARRFTTSPVAGRLRAKTGTLNQVTALAGYLETHAGLDLSFSLMVNLPPGLRVDGDDLARQEELAAVLARYPEGPPLELLMPIGPG